ncbi:MAG: alpha-glucan family phosphorylase [Herpetosiphonaceae bacterium]|nr:alpha-glucan family phosphorylase [Herpetosiphonaceae bacterium]
MNILGRVAVFPTIPQRISRLYEVAYNLWWSWHSEAQQLYADLDPVLWDRVNHNPVRQLAEVAPKRLQTVAEDAGYTARYDTILARFDRYMHPDCPTWFRTTYGDLASKNIAYFSAEFGLHESLPIYSGGLGVLAGDHIKEASDLGLPFIGIGFLYPQGYFTQRITRDGSQEAFYEKVEFSDVPATAATRPDGKEVLIGVELPGRQVYAKVWKVQIGRNPLYLLDTDVPGNAPADRELSARLYGGDHNLRISQEIILGIGGLRALRALGIDFSIIHLNDSHPVFAVLERTRELVALGLPWATANEVVRASTIFTTHTPVPAGNEIFNYDLIDTYFGNYWGQLGLNREEFHSLARQDQPWGSAFSMTVLALRFSSMHNGVSRLHGAVARKMWQFLWPGVNAEDVPITHVTNGVHTGTWLALELRELYDRYLPKDWEETMDDEAQWRAVERIPDAELWAAHNARKAKMIAYAEKVVRAQRLRLGEGPAAIRAVDSLLDPNAFTIGFARRFATYKRATLLLRDLERVVRLFGSPDRPVQIIYAGKAHPADDPGKSLIQAIYTASRSPQFLGRIVFLENYDMSMARHLVSGCDLWLNNPIRPYEASGTSGEKASLNGLPNCSILDGWWAEGYQPGNGWAIGEEREYQDVETQNAADADALYTVLEQDILPTFFERGDDGLPHRWLAIMKEAIRTCAPRFSMRRQVKDYTNLLYVPTIRRSSDFAGQDHQAAAELSAWKARVYRAWPSVQIAVQGPQRKQYAIGDALEVSARVGLGEMQPNDVLIELVGGDDQNGEVKELGSVPLTAQAQQDGFYEYRGTLKIAQGGSLVYGVRVVPAHRDLANKYELGLVRWA